MLGSAGVSAHSARGMQHGVTRPLPARLVLLALAAALAASMVFAMVVAEHRDGDNRPGRTLSAAPAETVDPSADAAVRGVSAPVAR